MDDAKQAAYKQSRKEWAREQRRAAYVKAKEQRANDPKQLAFKEAMKERQREAYQVAKARRKASVEQQKAKAADDKVAKAQQLMMLVNPAANLA